MQWEPSDPLTELEPCVPAGWSPQRRLQQASDNAVTATLSLRGAPALSTPSLAAALMTQLPEAASIQINSVQTRTDADGSISLATFQVLANSSADADAVATRLGGLTNSTALLDELNAEGVTATDVAVMDVSKPSAGGQPAGGAQQAAPSFTRDPNSLSGSALAGATLDVGCALPPAADEEPAVGATAAADELAIQLIVCGGPGGCYLCAKLHVTVLEV